MKDKIILLAVFTICAFTQVQGQTSDEEADAIVNLLGVQKKEVIAKLVPVTGKDSINFWKLYDEYLVSNKTAAKSRIKLYEKTANSYSNMTNEAAESLAKDFFKSRMEQEKSLETYYNKIKNATNATIAFEFYQAEVYILTQIRSSIMQQIPTYSEIKAMSKQKK